MENISQANGNPKRIRWLYYINKNKFKSWGLPRDKYMII